jgi:hypothetical protein
MTLAALRGLAARDPLAPATHVALAGATRCVQSLLKEAAPHWDRVDAPTAQRWARDRPLLDVAAAARERRLQAAWARIGDALCADMDDGALNTSA